MVPPPPPWVDGWGPPMGPPPLGRRVRVLRLAYPPWGSAGIFPGCFVPPLGIGGHKLALHPPPTLDIGGESGAPGALNFLFLRIFHHFFRQNFHTLAFPLRDATILRKKIIRIFYNNKCTSKNHLGFALFLGRVCYSPLLSHALYTQKCHFCT